MKPDTATRRPANPADNRLTVRFSPEEIRRIVADAAAHLNPGGWLLFEHGYNQGEASRNLLAAAGFKEAFTHPDLAGIARVSGAHL